jgi:hypothetical protein
MKLIIFLLCISSFATSGQLQVGALKDPQFTYELIDHALEFAITETDSGRKTKVRLPYTCAYDYKLSLTLTGKAPVEMLLAVLASGERQQLIQVYVPSQLSKVSRASTTTPICEIKNDGQFTAATAEELRKNLRMIMRKGKAVLQIKRSEGAKGLTKSFWSDCYEF